MAAIKKIKYDLPFKSTNASLPIAFAKEAFSVLPFQEVLRFHLLRSKPLYNGQGHKQISFPEVLLKQGSFLWQSFMQK